MNHEYRIAHLEATLTTHRRITIALLCAVVAIVTMGTTAVVSDSMTIANRTSSPVFVQLVGGSGQKLGSHTSPLWTKAP